MKEIQFRRIAGWAGLFSALLFLISIVGMQSYMAYDLDDLGDFTRNMVEQTTMMIIYGWPGIAATLLLIPLVYIFHKTNKSNALISKMLFVITLIGLSFITVGYLFHLALTYFHAPMYQDLAELDRGSFGLVIKSTIGLQDMFWLAGDLLSFLGLTGILLLTLKEKTFPQWILTIGIIAGVSAAFGSISFIPAFKSISFLGLMFIGGFSVFAIWEIIASLFLIRKKDISATQ